MNAQFQVAQATGSSGGGSNSAIPVRIFKLTKPLTDQAVTVNLGYDQKVQLDFTSIANEKITLVHVGEKLIILFDNKSTVTVEPFFDSRHDSLKNLTIEVAPGREVSVNEFASLFPISTDQSVLPAAGEGGNAQGSGANFSNPSVDPLNAGNPLPLLGPEELGTFKLTPETFDGTPDLPAPTLTFDLALLGATPLLVDESFIPVVGSQQAPAGSNTVTKDFGAALTIVASANIQSVVFALHVDNATTNLVDSKSGQPVVLVQNGNGEVDGVVTINGQQVLVFTMTVDGTGHVTFTELRGVHELTPGDFNEGILLGNGLVSLQVTVTDVNNHVGTASVDLGPLTTILDDGPSIDAVQGEGEGNQAPFLQTDESYLGSGSHTGAPGATVATGSFAGQFTHVDGADGASIAYAVSVNGGNGTDSHLIDSLSGHSVFLFLENGVIVGREGTTAVTAAGGQQVFTVEVDELAGTVTLTQLRSVHQGTPSSPDHSEGVGLTNLITLTATITDNDNDTDSASIDIGQRMLLRDDGPSIEVADGEREIPVLETDESYLSSGTHTGLSGATVATGTFAGQFTHVDGADGATIAYGVSVNGVNGADSHLIDSLTGHSVFLFLENGVVVGREGTDATSAVGGLQVFTVAVDAATGTVTLTQLRSVHQDTPSSPDQSEGVGLTNLITLTATITDVDGDYDSASIDIGQRILLRDDGPILNEASVTATVDEDGLPGHNADTGQPNELAGTNSATATGSLTSLVNFGADGPGSVGFKLVSVGTPVDTGLTSQGGHVLIVSDGTTLHGYVENGVAGSGFNGATDREVFTLTVGANGSYTFMLKDQIDHASLDGQSGDNTENTLITKLDLSAYVVATDADGDYAVLNPNTFRVQIQDDVPVLTSASISVKVDEDDILTPWSHGTSPNDGNADGSTTENATGAAFVSGSLSSLVSVGADEPGTFGFSSDAVAKLTALGLFSKQTATGDGENGKPLYYVQTAGAPNSHQVIITGYEPNPHGNPVFSLTLNTETGAYEFRLFDELIHMPGDGQNTDLRSGQPVNGVQGSIPNIDLGSIITFTDKDGDSVTLTGKFTVTVTDDVPHADIDLKGGSVTIDESAGNQADDTTSSSVRALFKNLENSGVVGDDPDVSGDSNGPNVAGNGAIAYAHSNFSVVFDDSVIGSDSPPYPHVFSLSVAGSVNNAPVASGLFTTDGSPIYLTVNADGLVIGTVSGGPFNGKVAFAVAIESDGEVSVAQYLSIKHDDRGDNNETNDNGSNSNDASPDDPLTVQQTLEGKIIATLTVKDSDGDTSSDSVNIGKLITFLDDGPYVDAHVASGFAVVHDETPGVQAADDDTTAQAVRDLFANIHHKGSDPDVPDAQKVDGAIGFAQSSGSALSVSIDFGADGPATSNSKVFSLTLSSNGTDSGINTTDGTSIFLFKEGDLIVGRYDGPDNDHTTTNNGTDPAAFAIAIDPVTGKVSIVQYVSLEHGSADFGGDIDEYVAISSGKVFATVTATDGDGDPVSDSADISGKIRFEDDGPTIVSGTVSGEVDEDKLPTGNTDNNRTGETTGTGSVIATGSLAALVNFGADGPDSPAFKLATQNTPVDSNLDSQGKSILIVSNGSTLYGYVENGQSGSGYNSNSDRLVFTLTVSSNGTYTFTLKDQIDHPTQNGQSGDNTENLLGSAIDLSKYVIATDGDGDSIKLNPNTFTIQVRDDIPIQLSGTVSGTVEEDDLTNANSNNNSVGNNEDNSVGKTVATGSLTSLVKVGADENGTFSLDSTGITALTSQGLTSHGTALSYSISGDTLTAKAGSIVVFTLKLESNGDYTFTLADQLDHSNNAPQNTENLLNINLSSVVRFTDYDSDSITLSGGFSITVQDDIPVQTTASVSGSVQEDALTLLNSNGQSVGNAEGGQTTVAAGSLATLVKVGADEPGTFSLASAPSSLPSVTSKGETVLYSVSGNTLTAYVESGNSVGLDAGDRKVFTLTVQSNGNYTFTLLDQLDHSNSQVNNDSQTLTLNLSSAVNFTDADGDTITLSGGFSIYVEDDIPVTTSNSLVKADEDDIPGLGNNDTTSPGDDVSANLTGTLQFKVGADEPASVGFASLNGAAVLDTSSVAVKAAGVALHYYWDSASGTLYASKLTGNLTDAISTAAFKVQVTDTATGAYTFTMLGQIDHPGHDDPGVAGTQTAYEDNININLTYTVTDKDGDYATGTLAVSIDDDMPILVPAPTNLIANGDFSQGTFSSQPWGGIATPGNLTGWTVTGSPVDPAGTVQAERVVDGYLNMHTSTHGNMIDMGASPGNIQISQQLSGLTAGQTYAIEFEAGAPFPSTAKLEVLWGNTVIGTIDPAGPMTSYSYVVTASGLAANDQITFREVGLGHAAIPGLADEGYHGTYLANVAIVSTAIVDEDGLTGLSTGNNDSQIGDAVVPNTDGDNNEATATGNLNIKWGADSVDQADTTSAPFGRLVQDHPDAAADRSVTFTDANVSFAGASSLTSKGEAITFQLNADKTLLTAIAGGRTVFEVSLSDDGTGSYRFVLLDQLDHAPNGNENDIALTFNYTATDSDGDAVSSKFIVSVDDDVPVQNRSGSVSGSVQEDALTLLNSNGQSVGNAEGGQTTVATGFLNALVKVGADEDGTYSLASNPVGLTSVTSKGETVLYSVSGNKLTAYVDSGNGGGLDGSDRQVFTLEVQSNGAYKFTLLDQLDHTPNSPANNDSQTLALNLSSAIKFTDADGDSITLSGGFTINVEDDIPTTASNTQVAVDEDDLSSGNHNTNSPGDDLAQPSAVTVNGTLNFSVGADEPASVGFASLNGADVIDSNGAAVKAGGVALKYLWVSDTLYATPDGTAAHAAFKIQVNPTTGAYSFTLLGQVDHPGHDDPTVTGTQTAYEDNLTVNLTYTVTDKDGDATTGTLAVNIDDDMPIILSAPANANLIVNGSFEQGHDDLGNNQWSVYHTIPGWTSADIGTQGPHGDIPFEIQTGNVGGVPAQDGNALVELDSDPTGGNLSGGDHFNDSNPLGLNATIQQQVAGTTAGEAYELTFYYSPRPNAGNPDSSSMDVLWNGQVVKHIDSTGMTPGVWQQITVSVIGTGPGDTLGFAGAGQANQLGALIDNVSLVRAIFVDEDGLTGPLSFGNHDSQPGDNTVANTDGDNNEATSTGYLNIKWGADNLDSGVDTVGATSGTLVQDHPDGVGDRSLTFTNTTVGLSGVASLTSKGDLVQFTANADGTILTGVANGRTVIEISLSDEGTGAFRVVLKDQLDHAPGNAENDIFLTFNYTATDSDGDAVTGSFTVGVDDDVPVANASAYVSGQVDEDDLNAGAGDNSTGIPAEGNGPAIPSPTRQCSPPPSSAR